MCSLEETGIEIDEILGLLHVDLTYCLNKPNAMFFSVGLSSILRMATITVAIRGGSDLCTGGGKP